MKIKNLEERIKKKERKLFNITLFIVFDNDFRHLSTSKFLKSVSRKYLKSFVILYVIG